MTQLPFDESLRQEFGLPARSNLFGAESCCIRRPPHGRVIAVPDPVLGDPEDAFRPFGLTDDARLEFVDDLLVHGQYRTAYECASFLASSKLPAGHTHEARAFLRLTAALAAIQGGLYRRAHLTLVEVREEIRRVLDGDDKYACLLNANLHLLFCRLAQVQGLPTQADEALTESRRSFEHALNNEPRGLVLIRERSNLDRNPVTALQKLKETERDHGAGPDHVLGLMAEHYYFYLRARLHLQLGHWGEAKSDFALAQEALDRHCTHDGMVDPLRDTFLKLGAARVKIGEGKSRADAGQQLEGLKDLRDIMSLFRRLRFTPGEYFAMKFWLEESDVAAHTEHAALAFHKSAHSLARRSGVLRFQLDSGLSYARKLFDYGRPLAAHAVLRPILHSPLGTFVGELKADPLWHQAEALEDSAREAWNNGIEPGEAWGLSRYAQEERDFVRRCEEVSNAAVATYGGAGSGRRILLERIARLRGLPSIVSVDATRRSPKEVEDDMKAVLDSGSGLVLYNLDLWASDAQRRAEHILRERGARRIFTTLSQRLEASGRDRHFTPGLSEFLQPRYTWNIDPLKSDDPQKDRRRDSLLLARGFLVRLLVSRGGFDDPDHPGNYEKAMERAKRLIFTADAGRYIKDRYTHIGDLYRAMEHVAAGLRLDLDVFHAKDRFTEDRAGEYLELPVEAILRLVPDTATDPDPAVIAPPVPANKPSQTSRSDVLRADADRVRVLVREFDGKLSRLAADAGLPRSTLIREWEARGLLKIWREHGGRRRVSREPLKRRPPLD